MMADTDELAGDVASRLRLAVNPSGYNPGSNQGSTAHGNMERIFPEPKFSIVGDMKLWDITEQFRTAAAALPVGTLVKDEHFTLFESVGALEIMDPKMDSGFLAPGEALVDDYDIFRELLPEEVLGIMDQLLCCEMAWHEGYPLAQTVFTSHYIDRLLSFEARLMEKIQFSRNGTEKRGGPLLHTVVRAYCAALIKCCDFALDEISRSLEGGGTRVNFYEDEDFSGHTYGRELFTSIPKRAIIGALYEAAEWVEAQLIASQSQKDDRLCQIWEAIRTRIDFRMTLLLAMATDEQDDAKLGYWQDVSSQLLLLNDSHKLAKLVSESFSAKIQRRLASTVPPKPMVELSFDDAFKKMEQMCRDCQEAVRIVDFGPENIQRLKAFLWAFSSRKPEPLSYARACLSAPLFGCDERGFQTLLQRDLEEIVLPQDPVLDPINWTYEAPVNSRIHADPHFELANTINNFTQSAVRMVGGYIDFFRALCSNRCRLRRSLCHVILALEHHQTTETEELDQTLHILSPDVLRFPLSTWTYHQKLRTMEAIVQLGFELEIYLPDELAGMYWYLSLLSSARSSLLSLVITNLGDRLSKAQKLSHPTADIARSITLLNSLLHESRGTEALSSALSSLYIYLSYLSLLPSTSSKSPFHNPRLRYELRMKPFLGITAPETPRFEEFEEAMHPFGPYEKPGVILGIVREEVLGSIEESVKSAKREWASLKKIGAVGAGSEGVERAWGKNVSSVLASCIATGITVATVRTAGAKKERQGKLKMEIAEPGKRYHDWWVVPKIVSSS